MKNRYVRRNVGESSSVEYLTSMGFSQTFAEVLSARGVTQSNFGSYFGDTMCWHSPFEMPNMAEAVETISFVVETGGSVLIYGDYDADGLTASSILSCFFTDNGVDNDVIVPTRDDGYGLHANLVMDAFAKKYYDLVITVDCGISNAEDVAKIQEELGVEVVVTDHHELPCVLPDCICVNPKMGYPFANLAGAGVAWKLVEALAGRQIAANYSDLACVGTIGDIMPMSDENRSIVKLGLANFQHKGLGKLAELSGVKGQLSANDVAMKIVPKINAAGRVGSPQVALQLLLCKDKADSAKAAKLMELNEKRKLMLDGIVAESDKMCDTTTINNEKMVFLASDSWQHGVLGIVAARYKEKFKLPAFVMTRDGDTYVGSARGIDTIDLFEVVSSCSQHLVKFGGHKASVGFSVSVDNLQNFRNALAHKLNSLDASCFDKFFYYDIDLNGDCTVNDVIAISQKLQPLLPQDKIVCRIKDSVKFANSFGKEDAHLSATLASGLEIKGFFKYGVYAPYIKNGAEVDLICTVDIDPYTKNPCGIVEDMVLCNSVCFDEFYRLNLLKNFVLCNYEVADTKQVAKLLSQRGTVAVFDDYETYLSCAQTFDLSNYFVDIFFDSSIAENTVVVSPLNNYDYSKYANVVYFSPNNLHRALPPNAVVCITPPANEQLYKLDLSREVCLLVYNALKNKGKFDSLRGVFDKYLLNKISYAQYVVALRVFQEVGLVTVVDKFTVTFDNSHKYSLTDSQTFRCFDSNK